MAFENVNPANHWTFQLANTFLLLSYASKDVLVLRILLMCAGLCFVVWGALILYVSVDTVAWNTIFTIINALRAAEVAWSRRPIQFEREEHEIIYNALFGPVGIGRLQFKLLMEQGFLRKLRAGTTYLEAGNDANNLTLVYEGSMDIYSNPLDGTEPTKIGSVDKMQFVESPQWANMQVQRSNKKKISKTAPPRASSIHGLAQSFSRSMVGKNKTTAKTTATTTNGGNTRDEEQQQVSSGRERDEATTIFFEDNLDDDLIREAARVDVTFVVSANQDITFFVWPMERLNDFLRQNLNLKAPVNAIIGADVATKLFKQKGTKASASGREGSSSISALSRRIYLPMDEPIVGSSSWDEDEQAAIVPIDSEDRTVLSGETTLDYGDIDTTGGDDDDIIMRMRNNSTINPLQAEKKWLERRGVRDTENDKKLVAILLGRTTLNKYELSALLSKGRWRNILREGTVVVREGEPMTSLVMLLHGKLSVTKEGGSGEGGTTTTSTTRELHTILPGQLAGSIEFNEPEREHVAGGTATSLEPCTYIEWELDDLRELLGSRSRLRTQLTAFVAADVSTKFRQVEDIV